jgi:hypothetical protein
MFANVTGNTLKPSNKAKSDWLEPRLKRLGSSSANVSFSQHVTVSFIERSWCAKMAHTLSCATATSMLAMRRFWATERVLCGHRVDFARKMSEKPELILVRKAAIAGKLMVEGAVLILCIELIVVQEAKG